MKEISLKRKRSAIAPTKSKDVPVKEENDSIWDSLSPYFQDPYETMNKLKESLEIRCISEVSQQALIKKYIDATDKNPAIIDYLNIVYRQDEARSNENGKLYLLYFKVKKIEPREPDLSQLSNFSIVHITEKKSTRPQPCKNIQHDLTLVDAIQMPSSLYNEIENISICSTRVRRIFENMGIKGKYDELLYDLLLTSESFKMRQSEVKQIKKKLNKMIKIEFESQFVKNTISIEKEYMQVQRKTRLRHLFNESVDDKFSVLSTKEDTALATEYCRVCFNSESGRYNSYVYCNSCGLSIHQYCYGLQEIPESFLCAKCKYYDNAHEKQVSVECALCGGVQGILKRSDKKWIHIYCVLFNAQIQFTDYVLLKGLDSPIPECSSNECAFCHLNKGIVSKCQFCKLSGIYAHLACAFMNGLCIKSIEDSNLASFGLRFVFLCADHSGDRPKDLIEKNRKQRYDSTEILNFGLN